MPASNQVAAESREGEQGGGSGDARPVFGRHKSAHPDRNSGTYGQKTALIQSKPPVRALGSSPAGAAGANTAPTSHYKRRGVAAKGARPPTGAVAFDEETVKPLKSAELAHFPVAGPAITLLQYEA